MSSPETVISQAEMLFDTRTYDAENRLLKKSYSDGTPGVSLIYDWAVASSR